jgi:hypothetical protein
VPALVGGADFTTGKFTHSLRYGYIKFINNLGAGANALGSQVYNPSKILGVPFELIGALYAGAGNEDAPQNTYQSNKQFRYDGTWTKGAHNIKYGVEVAHILQGGFAAFYSTFLSDVSTRAIHVLDGVESATNPTGAGCNNVVGAAPCIGDPLNGYRPTEFVFGNGNGSGSERPAFGLPGGGNFSWRVAAYVGDNWKITPSFTLVAGLRWSVDTDRANQDLPGVTCGDVDASLQFSGCDSTTPTKQLFDFFGPGQGLGGRTEQNYANFGPQAGFVYSPGSHKFALRAGAGIYYESDLFNNQSNVRAQNTKASFPSFNYGETVYNSPTLSLPGFVLNAHGVTSAGVPCNVGDTTGDAGCLSLTSIYNTMTLGQATTLFAQTDALYKAAAAVPQPNVSYIGFLSGDALKAAGDYSGRYKTPYSIQINGGIQYELQKGLVVSFDYVHNATLKVPLTVDTNHVGAARFLNVNAAKNAIASVIGDGTIDDAINAGATIDDFAGAGLDSGNVYLSGYPASANGVTPDTGAAFAGANPNVGAGDFILPIGKSAYDALQVVLQEQKAHPLPGIVNTNLQISYNLSRAVSNSTGGSNQFFAGSGAFNQDCVNCYIGRTDADRTNQLSLGGSFTIKYGLQAAVVGHFFSAPPENLTLGDIDGASQIYKTDVDGDGTTGDLIPGTRPGAYMHEVKGAGLSKVINNYNATQVGTLTPAGEALVAAGLFTQSQLVALGAVKQALLPAPTNPIQNSATRTLDASIKYPIGYLKRFREGLVITPGVTMYNVTNMSNYGNFSGLLDATDASSAATSNALNGPNSQDVLGRQRVLRGSGNGTFDQGGPRSTEFSLKIDF